MFRPWVCVLQRTAAAPESARGTPTREATPAPRSRYCRRPFLQLVFCAPCILKGQLPSLCVLKPYAHLFAATPVKLEVSQKVAGHSGRSESTLHSNSATPHPKRIPRMVFSLEWSSVLTEQWWRKNESCRDSFQMLHCTACRTSPGASSGFRETRNFNE